MQTPTGSWRHCNMLALPKRFPYILGMLSYVLFAVMGHAQERKVETINDSILPIDLAEVIVISTFHNALDHKSQHKPLSTLDEYLESSQKVMMIKRGAYAWEPVLNDMSSERLSVTIDGMRIFGACTDKMDPITSYVEVSNLSEAHVSSGQQGAEQGSTIGGAIDLILEKSDFKQKGWYGSIDVGGESNNVARIFGGELNYSDSKFYLDTDIIYRKADNYIAGGGDEVDYSQFEKYNLSVNTGYKLNGGKKVTATFIFDEARNVGYPALPMDVSLAQAYIGAVGWFQDTLLGTLTDWETKLYANKVTHVMDDSQREDVAIRMDMPGWSDTYGYFSKAGLHLGVHRMLFKFDGFYNRSFAEMTMYPDDPDEMSMYMLTWPDVRTLNTAMYAEDVFSLKEGSLKLSMRLAMQNSNVANELGLNSLRIFYPDMSQRQTRILKSVALRYNKDLGRFQFNGGLSYGDRAPSVSEGFGFYLYNSFDNHDYIGNPDLENEKALEVNAKFSVEGKGFKMGLGGNYFYMGDYIIGEVDSALSVMTIGAEGVKIYRNLENAHLYNISWDGAYDILPELKWTGALSYHRGVDDDGRDLPFISPFTYASDIQYAKGRFSGSVSMRGAGRQVDYNPDFGEDETDAYAVFSLSLGRTFPVHSDTLFVKLGVENIFDEYYTTYTDWNNIPRMGRTFFMTLSYSIN